MISVLAGMALAVPVALLGAGPAASDNSAAPAPENLRIVVNDQGFVDRLEWDPPSDGTEPAFYDVNYRFANDGPGGEQVFVWTTDTFLAAWGGRGAFGRFVECTPQHYPADEWIVWITYPTPTGPSERSNQVSMCFPLQ